MDSKVVIKQFASQSNTDHLTRCAMESGITLSLNPDLRGFAERNIPVVLESMIKTPTNGIVLNALNEHYMKDMKEGLNLIKSPESLYYEEFKRREFPFGITYQEPDRNMGTIVLSRNGQKMPARLMPKAEHNESFSFNPQIVQGGGRNTGKIERAFQWGKP